jgi:hypothetical protein
MCSRFDTGGGLWVIREDTKRALAVGRFRPRADENLEQAGRHRSVPKSQVKEYSVGRLGHPRTPELPRLHSRFKSDRSRSEMSL